VGSALMPIPTMASGPSYFYAPPEEIVEVVEVEEVYSPYDSCIHTARLLGVDIPLLGENGSAKDLEPNSPPTLEGLILFSYKDIDHVAVILSFEENGFWVGEGNRIAGEYSERLVHYIDPFIRGFATY